MAHAGGHSTSGDFHANAAPACDTEKCPLLATDTGPGGPGDDTGHSQASNTTGEIDYGARFVNMTGSTIASLDISFAGEQWKVMGLAPYGKLDTTFYSLLRSLIKVKDPLIKAWLAIIAAAVAMKIPIIKNQCGITS